MPLVKRKQVQFLPLPQGVTDGTIPPEQEVWQIKQTGEIFLDYQSFNDRINYYMEPNFTCELTGKSGLTYFGAVESEQNESYKIQQAFPDRLKPKVLRACHFQVEGRLERLVDLCYERFNHRFYLGEHVIITSPANGIKLTYFGVVIRVTPPKALRDLLRPGNEALLQDISERNAPFNPEEVLSDTPDNDGADYTPEELDKVSHIVGGRQLEIPTEEANTLDDYTKYVYSVQLLQGEKFDGSVINVDYSQLERDKIRWNKALLKKFLKESITRDPAVGSCWLAKPDVVRKYDFPMTVPPHLQEKGRELRVDLLERRRKPREEDPNAPPKPPRAKRPKLESGAASRRTSSNSVLSPLPSDDPQASIHRNNGYAASPLAGPSGTTGPSAALGDTSIADAAAALALRSLPKPKYPIEDLDLDPTTILDGRVRRAKHLPLPPLPKRPLPSKELPVPEEHTDRTLMCWNVLNIFGQALQISPFTLDDFVNALYHDTLDPRCILLGEIHSVLTNNIAAETHSQPVGAKASVDSLPVLAATIENTDGMSVAKREMWVNAALDYSRGWDRKARPRASDGRRGWERHLLGILTQKGGLEAVPSLPTIFKHLFTDEDYVSEPEEEVEEVEEQKPGARQVDENGDDDDMDEDEKEAKVERKSSPASSFKRESSASSEGEGDEVKKEDTAEVNENKDELADEEQMEIDSSDADIAAPTTTSTTTKKFKKPRFAGSDHPDPEARYLSLSLEHKLDILSFLCQINLQSKVVKAYIDDCETRLTEERKEKAEINKEKKELMAEKSALLKPKVVPGAEAEGKPVDASSATNGEPTSGEAASTAPTTLLTAPARMDEPSSSVAPSEAGDSAMPDEPPSRQPSSSPLPELDDSSSTHSMTAKDNEPDGIDEADQTDVKSDMPDDLSEPADLEEQDKEVMDEEMAAAETKSADGGDEQDELDIGSDVDELQSSIDEAEEAEKPDTPVTEKAPRPSRSKKGKGATGKKRAKSVDRQVEIEQELEMNAKKDDLFERDWRRFREVARIRPLGKDRFYQRIWWFDGIGPQSLIAPNGRIIYGTGRLFVQGPSKEDYDMMCAEYGGPEVIATRMKYEQGGETILSVDEWALYESSEDIDQLCNWLNNKGIREKELKAKLEKWKHYIVEGSKARQEDLLHGFEATAPAAHARRTRGARGSKDYHENPSKHYLAYENSLAQK